MCIFCILIITLPAIVFGVNHGKGNLKQRFFSDKICMVDIGGQPAFGLYHKHGCG